MKSNFFLLFLLYILKCEKLNYTNPIIKKEAPEPSIIKADDNYYYIFTTKEYIYRSPNLVNWEYLRNAFDNKTRPSFVNNVRYYWRPCITKQNDLYILYFANSDDDQTNSGIGVATSSIPEGPYDIANTNGKLFLDTEVNVQNSIHPNYFEDEGNKYIIFGYRRGIYGIDLNSDGLSVKDIDKKFQLAGNKFDLPYVYKRGNYYYLFASIGDGNTKDETTNTQEVVVGRSTNFKGPYITKNGGLMMDNSYEILITKNTNIAGPGSVSIIYNKYSGKTCVYYHAIIVGDTKDYRYPCMDELKWDDDWPYIETNSPSYTPQEAEDIYYLVNKNISSNSNKSEYIQDLIQYLIENYYFFNVTSGNDFEKKLGKILYYH